MQRINYSLWRTLLLCVVFSACAAAEPSGALPRYARAEKPTPVLNTPDFRSAFGGRDGKTLARDSQGLVRAVEFIALPGTVFQIENTLRVNGAIIYQVSTAEYPPQKSGIYIDSRFVSVSPKPFPRRTASVPAKNEILNRMVSNQGASYVWGGNIARGIPEMFQFYPPSQQISPQDEKMWALRGLDCSGLLYEASNGTAPRNTSELINFGQPVAIAGLSPAQIAAKLQPLDFIVWKGHVIFVLNKNNTIESCTGCSPAGGVTIRNLPMVLEEVMRTRTPVNQYPQKTSPGEKPFVIRRWSF